MQITLEKFALICLVFSVKYASCQVTQQAAETADENADKNYTSTQCSPITIQDIESHLSTKTPYRVVANFNDTPLNFPGCQPTRIWSLIRHGTRNPSKAVIKQAKEKLLRLRDRIISDNKPHLCAAELEQLRKWTFELQPEEEKLLVAEGEDELIELAERMQQRFPELLPDVYDPSIYYFKYTATQRTLKSSQSFATGLFGRQNIGAVIYPEALYGDPVLRFYKNCQRWKSDVDKNPLTFDNARKFLEEPEMQAAVAYIRNKTRHPQLTPEDAQLIYTICAFETAWHRRRAHSVWCNFFNRDTIKALEFAEDLEYYWNDGYGYELTARIACPAIVDMFENIDPAATANAKPNATFYFTHSGTLLKVLAHLGLHKDNEPLTYKDFKRVRQWRTSAIDAFATNLVFLRYDCATTTTTTPMILTLHQERIVRIPGCPTDNDLCSLATLRQLFADSLESCNFTELCSNNNELP